MAVDVASRTFDIMSINLLLKEMKTFMKKDKKDKKEKKTKGEKDDPVDTAQKTVEVLSEIENRKKQAEEQERKRQAEVVQQEKEKEKKKVEGGEEKVIVETKETKSSNLTSKIEDEAEDSEEEDKESVKREKRQEEEDRQESTVQGELEELGSIVSRDSRTYKDFFRPFFPDTVFSAFDKLNAYARELNTRVEHPEFVFLGLSGSGL